jgi:hypothetical protein
MITTTLTRAEAHDLIDAFAADDRLAVLARHWDLAGHWNDNAVWDADDLHQHADDSADGDDQRSNGPHDADDSGLTDPDAEQDDYHSAQRA